MGIQQNILGNRRALLLGAILVPAGALIVHYQMGAHATPSHTAAGAHVTLTSVPATAGSHTSGTATVKKVNPSATATAIAKATETADYAAMAKDQAIIQHQLAVVHGSILATFEAKQRATQKAAKRRTAQQAAAHATETAAAQPQVAQVAWTPPKSVVVTAVPTNTPTPQPTSTPRPTSTPVPTAKPAPIKVQHHHVTQKHHKQTRPQHVKIVVPTIAPAIPTAKPIPTVDPMKAAEAAARARAAAQATSIAILSQPRPQDRALAAFQHAILDAENHLNHIQSVLGANGAGSDPNTYPRVDADLQAVSADLKQMSVQVGKIGLGTSQQQRLQTLIVAARDQLQSIQIGTANALLDSAAQAASQSLQALTELTAAL